MLREVAAVLPARMAVLGAFLALGASIGCGAVSAVSAPEVHRFVIGHSVDGRPIDAVEIGDPDSPFKALVVGCIHGNECAGIPVARRLETLAPPAGVDLWVVPDLNPDGHAAGTRGNGRGVDINRNFPWHWRRLGGIFNSGSRPLSEPESRAVYRLILRVHPQISIWFHQHLEVVDESGGDPSVERRFAKLTGLPVHRLPRYPGGVTSWENAAMPGTTAFVVELPAGELPAMDVALFADAVLDIA